MLICIPGVAFSQSISEKLLQEKFRLYREANPDHVLFVHTDKTVYTNNETIWFSGYLVRSEGSQLKDHTILSVTLAGEDNRKIVLDNNYAMEDGLSFGSLSLPDSIPPGNYQFIAYTNVVDKNSQPIVTFTQSITIKNLAQNDFNVELRVLDTVSINGFVRVRVITSIKEPDRKERIFINYTVGKSPGQSVVLKGDEHTFLITIPHEQLRQFQPKLLTTVKYKNQVHHVSIKLPEVKSRGLHLRFFPEGGNLVEGLEGVVAWEAKTNDKLPVSVRGILYQDEQPIDTIITNNYGVGTFRIRPETKSNYTIRAASEFSDHDSVYLLPKPVPNGVTLRLTESVVKDTLHITLLSKRVQHVQVLVHNYRKIYASFDVQIQPTGKSLSIALGPVIAKGIATITVLDENGRPLAERLFFAHYNQGITTEIQTDMAVYNRKKKAIVQVKLTDKAGKLVPGIVSIAAIQDNRIESAKMQDIESYVYLNHQLEVLPPSHEGRQIASKKYLEDMLLTRGWRRYTWQDLMSSDQDTVSHTQLISMKGSVRYGKRPLKKPIEIISIRDSVLTLITTNQDGAFEFTHGNSLTNDGRHLFLSVNEKIKEGYTIHADNPFRSINQKLAESLKIDNRGIAFKGNNTADFQMAGMERTIALGEVTIIGKADNSLFTGYVHATENDCGDYVCEKGYLNCRLDVGNPHNRAPVKGKVYHGRLYRGCFAEEEKKKSKFFKVPGIYTAREFYGVSSNPDDLLTPQFISTLFWKPGVVAKNGLAELSFFTGDITGKFRIVVQGIGESDMIYGESLFEVK